MECEQGRLSRHCQHRGQTDAVLGPLEAGNRQETNIGR